MMMSSTKPVAPSTRQTFNGQGVPRITGATLASAPGSVDPGCGSNGSTQTRKKPKNLTISFSNIRGLRSNLLEVENFLSARAPDIFAVSETRLDANIPSSEVTPDGYVLHRLDRAPCHGLAVFSSPNLPIVRLTEYEDQEHEYVAFVAHFEGSTQLLFFLYRSPSANSEIFDVLSDKIDTLLGKYPAAEVVVFGDFNVHNVEWLVHSRATDSNGQAAHSFALSQNLSQIVSSPTRVPDRATDSGYLLDLFLTTNPDSYHHKVSSPLGTSDHCVVTVTSNSLLSKPSAPFHRTVHRFSKADWSGFRCFLSQIPWNTVLSKDVGQAAQEVAEWIQIGMSVYVPSRTFQQKPHSQPWFTSECAASISKRNFFFHRYQRDRNAKNLSSFKAARRNCRKVILQAKERYSKHVRKSIATQKLGSKDFWRICNSVLKRNKSSLPSLSLDSENMAVSSADKAELLCLEFAKNSSLNDENKSPLPIPMRTSSTLSNVSITVRQVRKIMRFLDASKASGPDGIPVIVLKECAPELAPVFTKLFRKCLAVGEFPSCWKIASVVPVPKKGCDSSQPSSYRPISLLPVIGKIFESILNGHLLNYLESLHLLSDTQYGFRQARSTGDLLAYVTEHVSRTLDRQGETRSVALDISKAFDKVWHKGLLHKLRAYGIGGDLLQLLSSFLRNRQISVVLDGQKSQTRLVNAGVPQGSVIGPTLFLLYINDLPDNIVSKLVMYADDTTLFNSLDKPRDQLQKQQMRETLNRDLQTVHEWGQQWLVSFNSSKTKSMRHTRSRDASHQVGLQMCGTVLDEQESISLLGLTVCRDLSWKKYLQSVCKQASQRVGCLYRARRFLQPEVVLHLYKSTVRPIMEYCCHLWAGAPVTHLSPLDRVERRVKNLVGQNLCGELQPLSVRRDVASLSLFYRYYFGRCSPELSSCVPHQKVLSRATRAASSSTMFHVQSERSRTVSRSRSFFVRTSQLWNQLPESVFPQQYDIGSFKRRVNRFLMTCAQ